MSRKWENGKGNRVYKNGNGNGFNGYYAGIGSRSELSTALIRRFCRLISKGLPISKVCDLVGIQYQTYRTWMKNGESYLKNNSDPEHWEKYAIFYLQTRKAFAEWELNIIERSLDTPEYRQTWIRDITILERRDYKNWGKKTIDESPDHDYPNEEFL